MWFFVKREAIMIIISIRHLVDEKISRAGERVNLAKISRETGLTRVTVAVWYNHPHTLKHLDFVVLRKWLDYLQCDVSDIIRIETRENRLLVGNSGSEDETRL